MKNNIHKSFLAGNPSWALALITLIGTMIIGSSVAEYLKAEGLGYIITGLLNAVACFYIVRQNPKCFWYAPLIINSLLIIAAIAEPIFWGTSMLIPVFGGLALSLITSIAGSQIGRRTPISDNPKTN
jgi:hypothetical protein